VAVARVGERDLIVTGGGGTVRRWDAVSGAPVGEPLTGHGGGVYAVAVARVGERDLIVTGGGGMVRRWDAVSGAPVGEPLAGHGGGVYAVAVARVGERDLIVTGGVDGTVRLWDIANNEEIAILLTLSDGGHAVLQPDLTYQLDGVPSGEFWYAAGLCRFEPGELDDYTRAVRRKPSGTPMFAGETPRRLVTGSDVFVALHDAAKPIAAAPPPAAARRRGRRIVALATEWLSGRGGLSTFNREMCIALAARGEQVHCVVLDPSDSERVPAQTAGVTLVAAARTPGGSDLDALSNREALPDGYVPEVIIGHGRVTGPAAHRMHRDFPSARRLHVIHMAPDEIEWYKLDRADDAGTRADERHRLELELASGAFRTVAVGPRLFNRYRRDLAGFPTAQVVRLDPGFDIATTTLDPRPPDGHPWRILLSGRAEDAELKGLDIAARAVAQAARHLREQSGVELLVRGAPEGGSAELRNRLLAWAGSPPGFEIVVRPYSVDALHLAAELRSASLVLVPSRSEGFGLSGLEAILAGVPVLVSGASGLGELIREVGSREQSAQVVVPVVNDADADAATWAREITTSLRDRRAAFLRAADLRRDLSKDRSWADAIAGLLAHLDQPAGPA
jgi:glycosyltransferase involved in cell wall biosynthesis